jgi:hypothetical protein
MVPTTAKPTLAADDFVQMFTNIEGSRTARLAWGTASARPITIGFWSAHKRTGVYSIVINSNLTPHRSYATTYSQVVSEKWEYHIVTIPGCTDGNWPNDNTGSIGLSFAMASGVTKTTPTPNAWLTTSYNAAPGQVNAVAATTDVFRITGVVVLPGIEAPPAERAPYIMRPYDQELLTCQRYYEIGQGPTIYYGTLPSGSVNYDSVRFSVRKRATPTITFNGWQYWSGGSAVALNPVVRTGTPDQFSFQILGATNFQGWDGGNATWIASARL